MMINLFHTLILAGFCASAPQVSTNAIEEDVPPQGSKNDGPAIFEQCCTNHLNYFLHKDIKQHMGLSHETASSYRFSDQDRKTLCAVLHRKGTKGTVQNANKPYAVQWHGDVQFLLGPSVVREIHTYCRVHSSVQRSAPLPVKGGKKNAKKPAKKPVKAIGVPAPVPSVPVPQPQAQPQVPQAQD